MVKHSFILILTLLLSACSSARLSYGFLDTWLQWRIDDYVSLSAEQQTFANQQLKEFHRWHRQTQLEEYSDFIERTVVLIRQENISTEELDTHLNQVTALWDASIEYLLPFSVALLQQLDESQKEDLLNNIKTQQAKERDENSQLSIEQQQQERLDKTEKRFKQWLGSINTAQQNILSEWARSIQVMANARDQRQLVWNQRFNELLVKSDNDFDIKAARLLFMDAEQLWPKSYTERFDQNKTLLLNMIVDVHQQMDSTQKQFLIRRLQNYQADFMYLAAR